MRERFGATDERAQTIRFHTQTGGVTLQAQQPEVNIIRVALQGFAAVCGGTQSLHTNGFDEALALPTERSARIALRTQQVIAHESGAADTADPFAGSYFIESLTDEIEARAWELIDKVTQLGGSVQALEFIQREIEESAASYHERYRSGQDVIVGVNKYVTEDIDDVEILRVDPEAERRQVERLKRFKESRDQAAVDERLAELRRGRRRRRQPALSDQGRAARRRLDRRGVRRHARGVRRVQGRRVLLDGPTSLAWLIRRKESAADGRSPGPWNRRPSGRWSSPPPSSGSWPTTSPAWRRGWRASWAGRNPSRSRSPTASGSACSPGAPSAGEADRARIALELAEKEFGTSVSIVAQHSRPNPGDVHAALEQLLDELGSPERRPFERA